MFDTKYDWQYYTTKNNRTNKANINENVFWPREKMLGGCSGHNGMVYIRGSGNDYKIWYEQGNREWHPDIVYQYFKKAENLQAKDLLKNARVAQNYGRSGPLPINIFNSTIRNLTNNIVDSWDEIGFKKVPDLNTANVLGSGIITVTASNGRRVSTASAYLNTVRNRRNLKVIKNTLVTKVLITDSTANGVQVDRNGTKMTYFANLEVIVSVAVTQTHQLL